MAVASAEDVKISLRRDLRGDEGKYLDALLHRVETMIRVRIRDLDARLADRVFLDTVAAIEAESVARVLRADNSGIYASESEDGYSYRLNFMVASGLLDILPAEWEKLGVGGFESVAPAMDGYLANRAGKRPDLDFQRKFGKGHDMACTYYPQGG